MFELLDNNIATYLAHDTWSIWTIIMVFLAGVMTSFTPCVYPMIPITVGVFGHQRNNQSKQTSFGPFFYVAGLAIVYAGLGVFAALSGKMFGQVSTHPLGYIFMANLCFIFAFWMLGWLKMPHFSVGQRWPDKVKHPYIRLFVMGAASGLVAAPCTAPVLAMLLMHVATSGSPVYGSLLMTAFAYGMGFLLLLLAYSSQWLSRLPRSGWWLNVSQWGFGLLMFFTGQYFLVEAGKLLF